MNINETFLKINNKVSEKCICKNEEKKVVLKKIEFFNFKYILLYINIIIKNVKWRLWLFI